MTTLSIKGLCSGYGKIEVLHDLDLEIMQGQIVTLIGANGAGKTTLLKAISGHLEEQGPPGIPRLLPIPGRFKLRDHRRAD